MRVGPGDPKILQDFLAARLSLSRRAAKEIVDGRRAWVNRKCIWMARCALKTGDTVETSAAIPKAPEKRHVRILWSGGDYLVCDKPAGMTSCDGPRSVEAVLREQEGAPDLMAVHRLDRDTTGCLLFARGRAAKEAAVEMFRRHGVAKTYHAIAAGRFEYAHRDIETPIDGKPAVSRVAREAEGDAAALLRIRIETGRTNQIRRHLASIRHPVVGDRVFGVKKASDPRLMQVPRLMLHASTLSFPDPSGGREPVRVHSPLPADFRAGLKLFGMGRR